MAQVHQQTALQGLRQFQLDGKTLARQFLPGFQQDLLQQHGRVELFQVLLRGLLAEHEEETEQLVGQIL